MKTELLLVLGLMISSMSAFASNQLNCASFQNYESGSGSGAVDGKVFLKATVVSNTELQGAQVSGAFLSDTRDLKAKTNYQPKNPRYKRMNKFFDLEDLFCWYWPLLPKNLAELPLNQKFAGYIHRTCEEWLDHVETIRLSCTLN